MNIHPLFVHFPIGILVLYTAFEFARLKFITKQQFYIPLKSILAILGTAAALGLVAITITGGLGASIVYGPDVDPVVHFIYSLFF